MGVHVILDDFGSGHSTLHLLLRLPVTAIKIDRSIVSAAARSERARAVLTGLASIARELSISVVAEGIETQAAADTAIRCGIRKGQGYLLDRPMPRARLDALLANEFGSR